MKYNGWLVSNNIVKRSVAVFGHYILGYLIVGIVIGIPVAILIGLFG